MKKIIATLSLAAFLLGSAVFAQTPPSGQPGTQSTGTTTKKASSGKRHHKRGRKHGKRSRKGGKKSSTTTPKAPTTPPGK